jgi:hypothetical protein
MAGINSLLDLNKEYYVIVPVIIGKMKIEQKDCVLHQDRIDVNVGTNFMEIEPIYLEAKLELVDSIIIRDKEMNKCKKKRKGRGK